MKAEIIQHWKNKGSVHIETENDFIELLNSMPTKLPNVKDWGEVIKEYDKYRIEKNISGEVILQFQYWLKKHYSAPLIASEQKPEKEFIINWDELLEIYRQDKNIYKIPIDVLFFRDWIQEHYPPLASPQPNKVSVSDEIKTMKCNNCGTKMVYTQNTNCCDECWLKIG